MSKFEFGVNGDTTSMSANFVACMKEKFSYNIPENRIPNVYRMMFRTIAAFSKMYVSKEKAGIGFSLLNDRGEFVIGSLLTYEAPEEGEDDAGNWNLSFSFDKADIEEAPTQADSTNDTFFTIANSELGAACKGNFSDMLAMTNIMVTCVENLKAFLDRNSESEECEITMPGIFTAAVTFEDGSKFFSITPGAVVKQLIKNDAVLSK